MRIGISLAQCRRLARPAAVAAAARAAEQLGYSSVWVCDSVLDPAGVLASMAPITARVGLGAYVSSASVSDPTALARSLATVNVLSEGRLSVVVTGDNGRLDDVLDALDPLGVPVLLDGSTSASLERILRRAHGWAPTGLSVNDIAPRWAEVREQADCQGRSRSELQLVVRADIALTERALGASRPSWHGDADEVAGDVDGVRRMGADEVVLRLTGDFGMDEALDGYSRIAEAAELLAVQVR